MRVAAGRLVLGMTLVAIWHWAAALAGPLYVADPVDVAQRVLGSVASGSLAPYALATLRVSVVGFAAGCLAGLALPLLLHPLPRVTAAVEPIVVASAGIPKYAVVPLLVLWLGIDDGPKLWLVGLLVFYPMFIGVLAGMRNIERQLVDMARVLGASHLTAARLVMWPSVLPFVFAALRIAVPRAVSAAIIGELLIGSEGIGYLIESSRQSFDTTGVFAGVIVATMLVVSAAAVVRRLERRLLAWRPVEAQLPI